jgi:hypothetical protein
VPSWQLGQELLSIWRPVHRRIQTLVRRLRCPRVVTGAHGTHHLAGLNSVSPREAQPERVREWTIGDVLAFFAELELQEYNAILAKYNVDGRMLQDLIEDDALAELGITKLHKHVIRRGLEKAEDGIAQVNAQEV